MPPDARRDPTGPALTVHETVAPQGVEPLDCTACGSTPSARPAGERRAEGPTCPRCGSPLEDPFPVVPAMPPHMIWRDYAAPPETVRVALEDAVRRVGFAYDGDASDATRVAFKTGPSLRAYGTKMMARIEAHPGRTRIVMRGRLRGPQLYGWGAIEDAARRVFHEMDRDVAWADRVLAENLRDPRRIWLDLGAVALLLLMWGAIYLALR